MSGTRTTPASSLFPSRSLVGHDGYGSYAIFGHYTEVEHRADPRKALYPNLSQYRAGCVCGWLGVWNNYVDAALAEGRAHEGSDRG